MATMTLQEISALSKTQLIDMVKHGMVSVIITTDERAMDTKKEIPQEFAVLLGHPISIGAAARKYNLNGPTISRWVKKGDIPIIGKAGQKVMIDEGYIANRSFVYHQDPGQGKRHFEREK
jgi:hypothetical protein